LAEGTAGAKDLLLLKRKEAIAGGDTSAGRHGTTRKMSRPPFSFRSLVFSDPARFTDAQGSAGHLQISASSMAAGVAFVSHNDRIAHD